MGGTCLHDASNLYLTFLESFCECLGRRMFPVHHIRLKSRQRVVVYQENMLASALGLKRISAICTKLRPYSSPIS